MMQRIIALFGRKLAVTQEKEPLDHQKILKNSNDARLLLCKQLITIAKTSQDRTRTEQLLAEAMKDRVLIPITVARRALYLGNFKE